jgi:hypothetical protein
MSNNKENQLSEIDFTNVLDDDSSMQATNN